MDLYKRVLRPLAFQMNAETAHHAVFAALKMGFALPGSGWVLQGRGPAYESPLEAMGLRFRNPVGLAAGFDKDAVLGDTWADLGFGYAEFGTVTPRPQPGNPKPRLFRLVQDEAIINRMGFNNAGADALASRLEKMHRRDLVVGVNIGKNKDTALEDAASDYLKCLQRLHDLGDYFVVNVSSPNTPGLRQLQDKDRLVEILSTLQDWNQGQSVPRPLLLKIAPDLTDTQLEEVAATALETQLAGLIATNTTIARTGLRASATDVEAIGAGGLSGAPLTARAGEVLTFLKQIIQDKMTLVGVGGIMEGAHAAERKAQGADLVQLYSGYVYRGPGLVREVVEALRGN